MSIKVLNRPILIIGTQEVEDEKAVFDFSGSKFTSLNMQLFLNNTSFLNKDVDIQLPSTLTSVTTNIYSGANGNYKTWFNSLPTVSSDSYIPANTTNLTIEYLFDVSHDNVYLATSWSSRTSQITLYATGLAVGTVLQPYTLSGGAVITWYSDEEYQNVVTESASPTQTYYGRVAYPTTRVVWHLTISLTDANVTILGSNSINYGVDNPFVPVGLSLTVTPIQTDPDKDILVTFEINGVDYSSTGTATITATSDTSITVVYGDQEYSPTLNINSWTKIQKACEDGLAGNFWAVGDTKTDTGTDGTTRTMRICDMQGLYNKHVVFEQVELESTSYVWNQSSNVDENNAYNNYSISQMRTTHLPAIMLKYSALLQSSLTDTSYIVATNGNNGTLLTLTDKLFLPAMKELFGTTSYSRTEEANALTQFQYYSTHNQNSYRVKYQGANANFWWSRSPFSGNTSYVCFVYTIGSASYNYANSSSGVAPCFSF